jgi:aarF domain-containing kinase
MDPEDAFETFSHESLASASIAQVHRATLKAGTGGKDAPTVVAVKVQKPAIEKQMEWDLFSYRWVERLDHVADAQSSDVSLREAVRYAK